MAELDIKKLNNIVKKTLNVISDSKDAIFDILEKARNEVNQLKEELQLLQAETNSIIHQYGILEKKVAQSKKELASINRDFKNSDQQMKLAYQRANELMVEMGICRERERQTILKRNDAERRIKIALETVRKAEKLVTQVGTVFDYLSGDLSSLDEHLEKIENKRMLSLRIIQAQEDERMRIAREIHDGPAQTLSSIVIMIEICERTAKNDIEKALLELQELKAVARDCIKSLRQMIYTLRPMSIDDLGLKPTIQNYIDKFHDEYNIKVDFIVKNEDVCIKDRDVALAIFRIVQECLNNSHKHASATHITVQIECTRKSVILRISDNGEGFDTRVLSNDIHSENFGYGILGMKERVELLEGDFIIESKINSGTIVRVKLPYSQ